jgi:hypothetical protein
MALEGPFCLQKCHSKQISLQYIIESFFRGKAELFSNLKLILDFYTEEIVGCEKVIHLIRIKGGES